MDLGISDIKDSGDFLKINKDDSPHIRLLKNSHYGSPPNIEPSMMSHHPYDPDTAQAITESGRNAIERLNNSIDFGDKLLNTDK